MSIKNKIDELLFNIGKDIKIHKIDSYNTIIEINYDEYSQKFLDLFEEYKNG